MVTHVENRVAKNCILPLDGFGRRIFVAAFCRAWRGAGCFMGRIATEKRVAEL